MQFQFYLFPLVTLYSMLLPTTTNAYNILFMAPFPAPSHWMWLEHFQQDLLKRGHHVTTVNNHPTKTPHENLTEIIIEPKFDIPLHFPKDIIFQMHFATDFSNLQMYWKVGLVTTEHALNDSKVQRLIASKDLHFDAVILEQFFQESFLMFGHKFNCPVITIGTLGNTNNMDHSMGLITSSAFIPHFLLPFTDQMSFIERAYNTYLSLYDAIMRRFWYIPQMQDMAERHFGKYIDSPLPSVLTLERNISLMLINSHRSTDLPRPSMPRLINVGGAHIKPAKPLPEDLQHFLDNSTHGVVYFSLGSYMKSTDMPAEKIAIILNAFGQLKHDVLWKYENESIGHLPSNVMIKKWMPQNDILAHSNLKLFITHGGIFGTQEGIYWGVPMLCMPLYGDQHRNTIKSVRAGYARSVIFSQMTSEDLVHNIRTIITDPKYKRSAMEISEKFRDNPLHPLDEASYWIEYIMRHKGAPHLKSYGSFIPLYQYLLLDLLFSVLLVTFIVVAVPIYVIRRIIRFLNFFVKRNLLLKKQQ